MRAPTWLTLLALVSTTALAQQDSVSTPAYSFQEIQGIWQRATKAGALDPQLVQVLSAALESTSASDSTPAGGGFIDLDEPVPPSAPLPPASKGPPTRRLPVKSLEATTAWELHLRAVLLERMLSMLGHYRPSPGPDIQKDADTVQAFGNAAHLELFMAQALFFLEGQTLHEKCLSYQRALTHARFLGWPDVATPRLPPGWEELARRAHAFHGSGFRSMIPPHLCAFRQAVRKSEVEKTLRGDIDQRILQRVEEEVDATTHSLTGKKEQYAQALAASKVEVPTRDILALRRAVEDSGSLYEFVDRDVKMLERAPEDVSPMKPQTSLLQQLQRKREEVKASQQDASSGEAGEALREARRHLARNEALLGKLTGLVREIALLPGLDAPAREHLAGCTRLPTQVTAEGYPAFVTDLDTCLTQIAQTYSGLKQRQGSNPEETRFADKVADLSKAYIGLVNSLSQGHQVLP